MNSGSESSRWVDKIDWHCNFQLAKTKLNSLQILPDKIKEICKEEDFNFKEIRCEANAPVMIAGESYLPCRYIIQLPFEKEQSWFEKANQLGLNLKCSKLRLFIPMQINKEEIYGLCKKYFPEDFEVSFII